MNGIQIINGRFITPGGILEGGRLVVESGEIRHVGPAAALSPRARAIDAKGLWVAPGFIDLHIHGGGGHDFMDGTPEAFLAIADLHARHGTTAMLPTTLSGSREELIATLEAYREAEPRNRGARFLGMHLEGPYFAMAQRGAQDPRFIRNPDPAEYGPIVAQYPFIRRWSAAPELPGALAFGDEMVRHGIIPSLAHTDAVCTQVEEAFGHGYTLATHLYSAMNGTVRRDMYRYGGAVEAAFLLDGMDVELIADGVHLPPELLRLVHKIKGPHRTALITDAMRAAGMPEGESLLGSRKNGVRVLVEDGVAKLTDRSAFAGSVATADRLLRTLWKQTDIPLGDIITMMSRTPARILGLENRLGSLEAGKQADIVFFDDDARVRFTMIGGQVVYS